MSDPVAQGARPRLWYEPDAKLRQRHAADMRLRAYGIAAVIFAMTMLAIL
ncbi:MAG: hypothetical protein CVT73_11805, partial [Alphaproteobacteria bacterium HGW-Alphaproteobacteria-12]